MKRISILALSVLAALSAVAALGATSASATVLCNVNEGGGVLCNHLHNYGVGTKLTGTLSFGAEFKTKSGETISQCSGGSYGMEVTNAGGTEKPVLTKDISGSLSGCTSETTFTELGLGAGEIELPEKAEPTPIMRHEGTKIKMMRFGEPCYYALNTGITPFTMTSGTSPKLSINNLLRLAPGSGTFCDDPVRMVATYSLTPTPLYVAAFNLF